MHVRDVSICARCVNARAGVKSTAALDTCAHLANLDAELLGKSHASSGAAPILGLHVCLHVCMMHVCMPCMRARVCVYVCVCVYAYVSLILTLIPTLILALALSLSLSLSPSL